MKLPRRNFLHLAAAAAALPAGSRFAWAQAYPARPVKIIVGQAAGSASDIVARLIAYSCRKSSASNSSSRSGRERPVTSRPKP